MVRTQVWSLCGLLTVLPLDSRVYVWLTVQFWNFICGRQENLEMRSSVYEMNYRLDVLVCKFVNEKYSKNQMSTSHFVAFQTLCHPETNIDRTICFPDYFQAQPRPKPKLEAEMAIFSIVTTTHPPIHLDKLKFGIRQHDSHKAKLFIWLSWTYNSFWIHN